MIGNNTGECHQTLREKFYLLLHAVCSFAEKKGRPFSNKSHPSVQTISMITALSKSNTYLVCGALNEHDDIHHRCDRGGRLWMIIIILSRDSSLCFCSTLMTKTFFFFFCISSCNTFIRKWRSWRACGRRPFLDSPGTSLWSHSDR